eukprot:CAMPEP_0181345582 /NCGR_PEP_ID=MMETSP1101-20121128/32828_1 /TAXON_ID=46948 /ORGANISM="Rhodomonas abbreviata, Strain Caron Lab Isolate" /LENGTH=139 /DNA_ID=CAMNT_0023457551 /DNA_START=297 /DNA_END=713 /DNA_ORIENTATION=-
MTEKQVCMEDGSGGGSGEVDKLEQLPRVLLGRVFRAERVLMGLRVCKWMHDELASHVEEVLLVGSDREVSACVVGQSFAWFQSRMAKPALVSVQWRQIGKATLATLSSGIESVASGGARDWLVKLDLSVPAFEDDGRIG